ncbi:LysR family transcriptional regulator [Photobacterium minamisatsumaniensis]|uniref:LysR family transcriptional regulator n=1 Tax=Photobacterium minamisatsumaniensis TaxID=2910233 RepID=UPI003D0BFE24
MKGKTNHYYREATRMFSYEHLKSFCATYEAHSYSGAARILNKDRTTIREQIKTLEDSYCTELFTIEGKKARPTPFSDSMYKQAKLIVRSSERLDLRMMTAYKHELKSIDIYHDSLMPNGLVLEIEEFMLAMSPNIIVNWLHRNRDEALTAVSNGHNKVAVMQHRMFNVSDYAVENIKLGDVDISAYARPESILFQQKNISMEDLELEKQYISENHSISMPEFLAISPNLRVVSNNDMLLELVKKHGWALMTTSTAEPSVATGEIQELAFKELTKSARFGLSFFYPSTFEQSAIYDGLLNVMQSYAKKHL